MNAAIPGHYQDIWPQKNVLTNGARASYADLNLDTTMGLFSSRSYSFSSICRRSMLYAMRRYVVNCMGLYSHTRRLPSSPFKRVTSYDIAPGSLRPTKTAHTAAAPSVLAPNGSPRHLTPMDLRRLREAGELDRQEKRAARRVFQPPAVQSHGGLRGGAAGKWFRYRNGRQVG